MANWIKGAIKHRGALTRSASAAGESPMEFAEKHAGSKGVTGKRARLATTLRKISRGRGRKVSGSR